VHVERIRHDFKRLKGDVALPTFDFPHMCPMQAGTIRKLVLRPTLLLPQRPNGGPHLPLDSLHQKQFEATLFLAILVITSKAPPRRRVSRLAGAGNGQGPGSMETDGSIRYLNREQREHPTRTGMPWYATSDPYQCATETKCLQSSRA